MTDIDVVRAFVAEPVGWSNTNDTGAQDAALAALDSLEAELADLRMVKAAHEVNVKMHDEAVAYYQAMRKAEAELARAREERDRLRRDGAITLWAVVMAAGGEVRVPNRLFVETGDLHRFPHPALDGVVFRATLTGETDPDAGMRGDNGRLL